MAPRAAGTDAGRLRAASLQVRLRRSDCAADRLSSCLGIARGGRRLVQGFAADRVCAAPAAGALRAVRRRLPRTAAAAARAGAAIFLSVQTDPLLGPALRLTRTRTRRRRASTR